MALVAEEIAHTLKETRQHKGFSQRELARLAGLPQSHISKIESGAVDLRLSSLVEIARALDLEVTLVPRKVLPAVKSIVRSTSGPQHSTSTQAVTNELARLQENVSPALGEHPQVKEIAQIQRQLRDLRALHIPSQYIEALREATKAVKAFNKGTKSDDTLREVVVELQSLRNKLSRATPRGEKVKPAYSLADDDHG